MYRTFDTERIAKAVSLAPDTEDFDAEEWVANEDNIALTDGDGNYILFQYEYPGALQGHYFFEKARGKEAISLSQLALGLAFDAFDVKLIFGLTPLTNQGALWLSRKIGFNKQGIVDTPKGPCMMFTMTKDEYEEWAE